MSEINLKNGGRPMLYWAGKHPIEKVNSYPAQLIERVNTENVLQSPTFNNLKDNWSNLLFHGDNKEILSTLLTSGFRSKIDLIYIDPPFDSKADYIKKIKLRKENKELQGEEQSLLEQVQYTDIWRNDEYLQFMYERLILLRELLSEQGSIYLHCDWHKSHYLRCMMDEVFGEDNFRNEIIWSYSGSGQSENQFKRKHDVILFYTKSETNLFNWDEISLELNDYQISKFSKTDDTGKRYKDYNHNGKVYKQYLEEDNKLKLTSVWTDIYIIQNWNEKTDYPTQKPEALLERIIKASSNPDSIVLDCFCGSGTTLAVAEKLGRKWIACDINKGAIQTTIKRLQNIINEEKTLLDNKEKSSILHYKVNNYDFQEKYNMEQIIRIKYGVENINNNFFDGTIGEELVKIVDLNKPLTKLDIELIKNELKDNQTEETRNIVIICNGSEVEISSIIEAHNKKSSINKIKIRDIQKDGIITYNKPEYDVQFSRNANKVEVEIKNYISPTILERLQLDKNLFEEQITDFRSMIDYVLIDNDFKGDIFNIYQSDIPERKNDFITGKYSIEIKGKIAIKIVDMLGEESLVVEG